MSFYLDPAFYVVLALAIIPAIVLGVMEKSQVNYTLGISVVFLALLFAYNFMAGLVLVALVALLYGALQLALRLEFNKRIWWCRFAVVLSLAPLMVSKLFALWDLSFAGLIGLSYLTFKAIQVLLEISDGLITKISFKDYLLFMLFFAPFTSGPIARSRAFLAYVHQVPSRCEYLERIACASLRFVQGLAYAFILAPLANQALWAGYAALHTSQASIGVLVAAEVLRSLCYGLYLFFDFAGYSLLAIASAQFFGGQLPENFKAPFASLDMKDFWNRWHMSLSFWLRDYLFMRLVPALLKSRRVSRIQAACAGYMANMMVMGLWHGITLDFALYGLYHGLLLSLVELIQKKCAWYKRNRKKPWFKVASWTVTMIAIFVGFSIFSGQISELILGAIGSKIA